jgi:hypothetical protein
MSGFISSMVGATYASAAPAFPLVSTFNSTSGTDFDYTFQPYSYNQMSYVGPDTSNNPVFLQPFTRSSTNQMYVGLIKINATTGGVTVGGITQITSVSNSDVGLYADTTSEYMDANGYGAGSGVYAWICYHQNSPNQNYRIRCLQIDKDAMTVTAGTALDTGQPADANQPIISYIGNNRVAAGGRYSGVKRFSRSGTTMTAEGVSLGYTHQIDNNMIGFANNGSTQYRIAGAGTGGGAEGINWQAGTFGTTNYLSAFGTVAPAVGYVGGTASYSAPLNNTDRFISFATYNKILTAHTVTWNPSSAPTIASGTSYLGTANSWPEFTDAYLVPGWEAGKAVIVLQYQSNIKYREITVTGNSISVGSEQTLYAPGSAGTYPLMNNYYRSSVATATVGTAKYLCTIQVQNGQPPIIVGARIA